MNIVFLNGKFIPKEEATISVMDRGFLFGDGIYEVIPVYNGKLFRCQQHIQRLKNSLDAIHLPINMSQQQWQNILQELLDQNEIKKNYYSIYLQITRGTAEERKHTFPAKLQPTIFAMCISLKPLSDEELNKGLSAITQKDIRWERCYIKSTSLLSNVLLYQEAQEVGATETILIRDGKIVEGATSNIFIVKDNVIKTPPLSNFILNGITRELVLELAKENQIPYQETSITEPELRQADEIWITSSTREIYPIVLLDGKSVGKGVSGPVWKMMIQLYRDFIHRF